MTLTELFSYDIASKIGAALLCGMAVGLNRDLNRKPAGVRTFGLLALGTVVLTIAMTLHPDSGDASRVVQGIVTGIGFLGAGMIMRPVNDFEIHGLTTAAAVWTTAVLAILCGLGQVSLALVGLAVTLFLLWAGLYIERAFERWFGVESPDKKS